MPSIASRKPVTTYSRRKMRSTQSDVRDDGSNDCPSARGDPGDDDISFSEMVRRMKKRSRDVTRAEDEIEGFSSKKSKQKFDNVNHQPCQQDLLANVVQSRDYEYETPFQSPSRSAPSMQSSSPRRAKSPDKLSPVPKTRSIHRMRSRNLKENTGIFRPPSSLGLASPFSSRPPSLAGSPTRPAGTAKGVTKPKAKKTPFLTKARTMSNTMTRPQNTDSIFSSSVFSVGAVSRAAPPVKEKSLSHRRAPSLPSNAPNPLDGLDAQDWSIPPKAVLRTQNPDAVASFVYDASTPLPELFSGYVVAASTPARRPLADKGPDPNFHSDEAAPLENTSMLYGIPLTRPITPESPAVLSTYPGGGSAQQYNAQRDQPVGRGSNVPQRSRRRTMVHISSDSIFSSSLDFTAQVSRSSFVDTDRTRSLPGSAGRSSDDMSISSSMELTSLIGTTHTHTRRASESSMDVTAMVNTIPHGQIPLDPSAPHSLRSAFATPANSPSLASLAATTASVSASVPSSGENNLEVVPSPGGDELGDLLSGLGLDEPSRASNTDNEQELMVNQDDSGLMSKNSADGAAKRRTRAGTIRASDYAWSSGKDKARSQGRNRAGTIRASDFQQGKAGSTAPQLGAPPAGRPRGRSRSGTVSAPKPNFARPSVGPKVSLTSQNQASRRPPLPTMKVKNHEEPLSPQKPGEPDDELLLVPGGQSGPEYDTEG